MKLVIESTDAIFGRVLELLNAPIDTSRHDWIEKTQKELTEKRGPQVAVTPASFVILTHPTIVPVM